VAKQPIRDAATKAVAEHPRSERVACIPAIFARFVQYEFVISTRSRKWIQKYDRVGSRFTRCLEARIVTHPLATGARLTCGPENS
jgi:hypothetical protein